jgi:8-oxo-dGTP diphosphatase
LDNKLFMEAMFMEELQIMMIVVALAIVSPDGQVLVQQRSPDKAHGGLWEFPGGKLEAGETPESALIREIVEELGVSIESSDIAPLSFATNTAAKSGGQTSKSVLLLLYTTTCWRGTPVALEPGTHLNWVSAQELLRLPMPPLDIPLAQALIPMLEGVAKGKRAT